MNHEEAVARDLVRVLAVTVAKLRTDLSLTEGAMHTLDLTATFLVQEIAAALRASRQQVWREARIAQAIWQDNRGDFYDRYHCDTFEDWCRNESLE